jgi:hypothetical protein
VTGFVGGGGGRAACATPTDSSTRLEIVKMVECVRIVRSDDQKGALDAGRTRP